MATHISLGNRIELGNVMPILRVSDLAASVDYYVSKLGFKVNWGYPESGGKSSFASISRGRCCIFLSVGDQGHFGSWVWIDGKHIEALYHEFVASGAKVRNPPTNYPWAMEMQIEDLDGNILRFGSDPKKDQPSGPWLDMNGDRWIELEDGSHTKLDR